MNKINFTKFQKIIENTDWDNELIRQGEKMNGPCWLVIIITLLFFGTVISEIIAR